jgi:hypothetical protein
MVVAYRDYLLTPPAAGGAALSPQNLTFTVKAELPEVAACADCPGGIQYDPAGPPEAVARTWIIGNAAAFGGGPITTFNFADGATVGSFVPDGAGTAESGFNGRGMAVFKNEVYYTELADQFGATASIHVAPFNGGAGGADTRTIPSPRPSTGIQDLAFSGGVLYVLTGYFQDPLQVFGLNPVSGEVLSGPITIGGSAQPGSDGFTVLPNGNFLINNGDTSCTYNQYDPSTGANIEGTTIVIAPTTPIPPGFDGPTCTGVDTDGTSLFFLTNFNSITKTDMAGTYISTTGIATSFEIEDIAIVR